MTSSFWFCVHVSALPLSSSQKPPVRMTIAVPSVVSEVWTGLRESAEASTRPARGHVAPRRGVFDDHRAAPFSVARRRPRRQRPRHSGVSTRIGRPGNESGVCRGANRPARRRGFFLRTVLLPSPSDRGGLCSQRPHTATRCETAARVGPRSQVQSELRRGKYGRCGAPEGLRSPSGSLTLNSLTMPVGEQRSRRGTVSPWSSGLIATFLLRFQNSIVSTQLHSLITINSLAS